MSASSADWPGNHIPCELNGRRNLGLIKWAEGKTFTEYLVKVDRNNYIYSEDGTESLFSFGEIMSAIKNELVYVEN